jgi:bacterioferritin
MRAEVVVIEHLNAVLRDLLTAINQSFLHSRMSKDWGFSVLGDYEYKRSIALMKSADRIIERVLLLDGLPNLQDLGKLMVGENVPEVLSSELALETSSRDRINDAIACCEEAQDYVSRVLFESVLSEAEEGIDWLETQIRLSVELGDQIYLQSLI